MPSAEPGAASHIDDHREQPGLVVARGASPPAGVKVRRPRRTLPREIAKEPDFRSLLLGLLAARLARPGSERCRVDLECWPGVPYHRNMLWKVAFHAGMRLLPYRGGEPARGGRPGSGSSGPRPSPPRSTRRRPSGGAAP